MFVSWLVLVLGGFCEAGWAYCLNRTMESGGWWFVGFAALYILSAAFLAIACRKIPVGTAYAVWTGIGATTTIVLGVIVFGEPLIVARMVCMALIFAGVIGLYVIQK